MNQILQDYVSLQKGKKLKEKSSDYSFGFLVHARGYKDIYRKYPFFKFLPRSVGLFIVNHLWPITVSRVTGLKNTKDGSDVVGYVLGITMTAEYMMSHRDQALQKIREALYLARGKGISIVGLGGLTASLSAGGKELLDIPVHITTGHAYTAYNVTQNVFKLAEIFQIPKEKIKVAVVGAAGSVGSMSALLIAREHFPSIRLIDLERKQEHLLHVQKEMKEMNPEISAIISHEVKDIADCDFVITATNTPEALITPDLVRPGMVIVDDAQPSDIHADVLKMGDVLTIEAGVVDTPGVYSHFNFGLKEKTDNFCCMAELLILAANKWSDHYVIHRATLAHIDEIRVMGRDLGFHIAHFQNFLESISLDKIHHVKGLAHKKHGI